MNQQALSSFIWSVADLPRGDYKQSEYGKVILPFTENSKALNPNLRGRDMREAFNTDEYQILLVANKFQTGFDQPLLCGVYLDKRLAGIQAGRPCRA
ncbi:MAG: hypothetical protein WA435_05860 [Gallionellaceae bacterium]